MIIEIRKYTLKPNVREDFIAAFEQRLRPAFEAIGVRVVGPMTDSDDANTIHWMRMFDNQAERKTKLDIFFDAPLWTNDLKDIFMPMIDTIDASVTETTPGFTGLDSERGL